MVKLACRLSGYLINHVFSIKTPTKLHNFCILWRQRNFSNELDRKLKSSNFLNNSSYLVSKAF